MDTLPDGPSTPSRPGGRPARDRRFKRGVYLLPTLFTVGNLFCGYASIVAAHKDRFAWAAFLIFVAAVLDTLDGRVARLTGGTSEFGEQLDSLADALSFGVAPSLLVQSWALEPFGRVGWLAAFLFVVCGVVRLARFNIQSGTGDKRFFIGLPIPAAAMAVAAWVLQYPAGLAETWMAAGILALVVALSLLMVSRLRFRSFKDLDLRGRVPSVAVVVVALAVIGVAVHPQAVVLALTLGYVVSGLLPRRLAPRVPDGAAREPRRHAPRDHAEHRR
jgi:CDP-diacylglycerol---serine O-phosphatidyltransferase